MEFIYKIIILIIILVILYYFFKTNECFDSSYSGYLYNIESGKYIILNNNNLSITSNIFSATTFQMVPYNTNVYAICKIINKSPLSYNYIELINNQNTTTLSSSYQVNFVNTFPKSNSYNGILLYSSTNKNIYVAGGNPGSIIINSNGLYSFTETQKFTSFITV